MANKVKNAAVKSWRTTLLGVLGAAVALGTAALAQFDSDPATIPMWAEALSAAMLALGLTAARDNAVSSKDAGAE